MTKPTDRAIELLNKCKPIRERIAYIEGVLPKLSTAPTCKASVVLTIENHRIELNRRYYAGEEPRLNPGMDMLMLGTIKALKAEKGVCEAYLAGYLNELRSIELGNVP